MWWQENGNGLDRPDARQNPINVPIRAPTKQ